MASDRLAVACAKAHNRAAPPRTGWPWPGLKAHNRAALLAAFSISMWYLFVVVVDNRSGRARTTGFGSTAEARRFQAFCEEKVLEQMGARRQYGRFKRLRGHFDLFPVVWARGPLIFRYHGSVRG